MKLPYGTMSDNEMRQLEVAKLQDSGFIFLWVTGRAMELGNIGNSFLITVSLYVGFKPMI